MVLSYILRRPHCNCFYNYNNYVFLSKTNLIVVAVLCHTKYSTVTRFIGELREERIVVLNFYDFQKNHILQGHTSKHFRILEFRLTAIQPSQYQTNFLRNSFFNSLLFFCKKISQ